MMLSRIERWAMNNPVRAADQHSREAAWFRRFSDGGLHGQHVLVFGCGRGVGVEVLLDRPGARQGTAFDVDPAQIERARRRRTARPARLRQPAAPSRRPGFVGSAVRGPAGSVVRR